MLEFYKNFFNLYQDFSFKNLNLISDFFKQSLANSTFNFFDKDSVEAWNDANQKVWSDKDYILSKNAELKRDLDSLFYNFYKKFFAKSCKCKFCENDSEEVDFQKIFEKFTDPFGLYKFNDEKISYIHPKDKRFSNDDWNNFFFEFIKDFYGIYSNWMMKLYTEKRSEINNFSNVEFLIKQYIDAIAPSNIPFLNPSVIKEMINSNGESIVNGFKNFISDISNGKTLLNPTTNDNTDYIMGKNIAATKGKVVYQNDLMQLIQYDSVTKENYKVPILIIPPWINKFYVMDLSSDNSFVKWLTEMGFTVFIVSWVNPDGRYRNKSFENYANEGLIAALNKIYDLLKVTETNVIGYCLGGTLLASTIALLNHSKNKIKLKNNIKTATLIATLTNFKNVGDFALFTSESYISYIESLMEKTGYLDKDIMFKTFNLMKANDMIWSTFVNNYLLGKDPIKLDVLTWNSDTTNMPYAMHSFLLRNMYQKNLLKVPEGISLLGVPIDLRNVKVPVFMIATEKDHIAPWSSTFEATKLFTGPIKFVLGGSGHVAGVINSIKKNKYYYYTNDNLKCEAEKWITNATKHIGSWWKEWEKWIDAFKGEKVPERKINEYIEDAPGSYVLNKTPSKLSEIK